MAKRPSTGKGVVVWPRLPAEKVKSMWSESINRVAFGGERIVCTRHGKPVAVLVPIGDVPELDAA